MKSDQMGKAKLKIFFTFSIVMLSFQWIWGEKLDSIALQEFDSIVLNASDENTYYPDDDDYETEPQRISYARDITSRLDSSHISAVSPDEATLSSFKNDPDYNYYEHQIKDERSIWDYIMESIRRWLSDNTEEVDIEDKTVDNVVMVVGILLLIGLLFLLYRKKPSLFYRNKKVKPDYKVEEENIYGIDFDQLIAAALKEKAYTHAIRWKYLQTLKWMEDRELIKWNPNKTVIEYCYELKNPDLRNQFRTFSTFFLYFRYGNFESEEVHFNEMKMMSDEIKKALYL